MNEIKITNGQKLMIQRIAHMSSPAKARRMAEFFLSELDKSSALYQAAQMILDDEGMDELLEWFWRIAAAG